MKYEVRERSRCKLTKWSGGDTTELYIFPPEADYGKRQFRFRISSAMVEDEESTFTPLPGIRRTLMVLKGKLLLSHRNHYQKRMNAYEQDCFWGDFRTTSRGKVTDLNLMTDQSCEGSLEHFGIRGECKIRTEPKEAFAELLSLYIAQGSAEICAGEETVEASEGEFVCFYPENNRPEEITVKNAAREECHVVSVRVHY